MGEKGGGGGDLKTHQQRHARNKQRCGKLSKEEGNPEQAEGKKIMAREADTRTWIYCEKGSHGEKKGENGGHLGPNSRRKVGTEEDVAR